MCIWDVLILYSPNTGANNLHKRVWNDWNVVMDGYTCPIWYIVRSSRTVEKLHIFWRSKVHCWNFGAGENQVFDLLFTHVGKPLLGCLRFCKEKAFSSYESTCEGMNPPSTKRFLFRNSSALELKANDTSLPQKSLPLFSLSSLYGLSWRKCHQFQMHKTLYGRSHNCTCQPNDGHGGKF